MTYEEAQYAKNTKNDRAERASFGIFSFLMLAIILFSIALIASLASGCRSFYENTGSRTIIGDIFAPIELSNADSSATVRLAYSLTGADVWTSRDSEVRVAYTNSYTNTYFWLVSRIGTQLLDVTVTPLSTDPSTDQKTLPTAP